MQQSYNVGEFWIFFKLLLCCVFQATKYFLYSTLKYLYTRAVKDFNFQPYMTIEAGFHLK